MNQSEQSIFDPRHWYKNTEHSLPNATQLLRTAKRATDEIRHRIETGLALENRRKKTDTMSGNKFPSIFDEDGLLKEEHSDNEHEMEIDELESPRREEPETRNIKRHYEKDSRKGSRNRRHHSKERPFKKARHARDTAPAIEDRIQKSENAIRKLEAHRVKETFPKTLRYNVKALIRPKEEFKKEIGIIRKQAEQKLLGAVNKVHYRNIDSNQRQLKKEEERVGYKA